MRRSLALLVLLACCAVLVVSVLTRSGLTVIDQPVLNFMLTHRTAELTEFFRAATQTGGTVASSMVITGVALFSLLRRWWVRAAQVAVAGLGAWVLVVVGKAVTGRRRPPVADQVGVLENLSFPSGHALGSTVAAVLVVVLAFALTASRAWRAGVVSLAAVYVIVIGLSRLYLGVHWATDVLGGWAIGAAWATVCGFFLPLSAEPALAAAAASPHRPALPEEDAVTEPAERGADRAGGDGRGTGIAADEQDQ